MARQEKKNHPRRIDTNSNLEKGLDALCAVAPELRPVIESLPAIPLRQRAPGFRGLAEIITAQQVSKASASAIFGRLTALIDPLDAPTFLASGEPPLIEAGLSRAKQSTLTNLAHAIEAGDLNPDDLCIMPVEEAMQQLTALKGIGPWTAEVFLLFCAGHPDIFPAGDIALQQAAGDLAGLKQRPDEKTTRLMAQQWSPWRGVAARVLYAHYSHARNREVLPI